MAIRDPWVLDKEREDRAAELARGPSSDPPTCYTTVLEECRLEAHNTGEGWSLAAVDKNGDVVCYLAFPKAWGESVSADQLRSYGFEVV